MAADLPDPPERSISDATPEVVQLSPCCQVWKNKYLKAEKGRARLKQALRLYEAFEEEKARSKVEKEGSEKELALRVSLENKSEISNLNQRGVSDVEDKTEEIKFLKASVSDREKEINWLKELVQKEKKRADLETKKAADASKNAETEKGKAGEEQRRADIERKKAEDYKTQLEALSKEVSEAKSKLVSETSNFDVATKQLQEEKNKAVEERKHADLEMAKAKEQRKIAEKTKKKAVEEIKHADLEMTKAKEQRKIAEDTKKKAVEERKHANLEMANAEEQRKIAEETKKKAMEEKRLADLEMAKAKEQGKIAEESKKRAVEERKHADLEMVEAEEQRKIAEETMKKAVEVRKCADFEMAKAEEQRKIAEETKKAAEDRKHAVVEVAKVEEQRKIAEAIKKTAIEEKSHADSLTKQLEEAGRREEELEKKLHELSGSKNLGEGCKRKQADSEMRKALKKRKLVEVNAKKAMDGKNCGDHLSKQLEDARLKINELQKQIHELSSSRKLVDALVVSSDKGISAEVAEVKLLKKQLKLEKKRVKHAKDVARFEKIRNNFLQQEVGSMKLELIQFLNRLDALDKYFSTPSGAIDDMEKVEDFASMQWSKFKKKLGSLKLHQTCPQTENQLLKTRCIDTTASNPLGETFQHDPHLLLIQGGNCTESITGINSKSESLLGGCNRKILRSSAINSSTASFSDKLVGSQERGAFSVTTSAKLGEDNLNLQPTISSMSGEVTKNRCNENLAVVAESSVRSPLPVVPLGRVNSRIRRKMILDAVEAIELFCSESKKLHLQLEDKLSVLHSMVKGQMDKPREAKLVRPNLQDNAYSVRDRSFKRRKTSNEERVAMEQSCDGLQLKQMQSFPEDLCNPDTIEPKTMVGFDEVVNKNYMKLLDLDDAAEEERYRVAAEMPVSPTLPVIEFTGVETFEVDQFRSVQDVNCEKFSLENENVASSNFFDVMNVENGSDKLQCNRMDTLPKLLHENECSPGSFDILRCNKNGFSSTVPTEKACLSHSPNPGVEVEMPVVPSSGHGEANIPFESEIKSTIESIPKYCVMFSNNKDSSSVFRILCATKACMARCSLPAQTEFVVHRILHALKLEEKLLSKEKVCVFFSLVLLNFYTATSGKCSLIRDFKPSLNLFAEHINEVMSDAEPRCLVAELCLDELLSVVEDFLVEGRVVSYTNLSSEASVEYDSRIHVIIDGLDIIFSHEAASADMLVAGSIILGSICAAADHAGFMCEAAYNIFRMHRYDTSVALIILHVFAYVGGDTIFALRNYSLTMTVLKSMVMLFESERAPVAIATLSSAGDSQPKFHACVGCPFSKDALSVDIVVSLLLAKLQNYVQSGIMHQDPTANSLNSSVTSIEDKAEQNLSSVLDMNCGVSCCLDKHNVPGKQSGSVVTGISCYISDVLSLVELLACNMSWDWTCKKIISQLWCILESSVLENLTVAIIILVGQLGRLGVDAVGYEDKEVENLRVKLSAFLRRETTIRAGLPIQLATVTALLGLISLDFDKVILENVKLPVMSGQFVSADLIRNWYSLLTEEQQAMSISLFQCVD